MQRIAINVAIGSFYLKMKGFARLVELGHPLAIEWEPRYDRWREEKIAKGRWHGDDEMFFIPIFRNDPLLIQVIDELKDQAAGTEVIVVNVPDGVIWGVTSDDPGNEWVYEQHRTWSAQGERVMPTGDNSRR